MKKILFVLVIVVMVVALVACARARENAVENMIENIIEKESGEKVDIDIDKGDDEVTIKTDEGEVTFEADDGGIAWPSDKLPAGFPMLDGVKVISVVDIGTGIVIGFEGANDSLVSAYVNKFTADGWEVTLEIESEGQKTVMTSKGKTEFMQIGWNLEDGKGTIIYGKN